MSLFKKLIHNWGWLLFSLLLSLLLALFFLQKTNLVTSDLGRHLANGREILQSRQALTKGSVPSSGSIFETNYYSYTHPDFPTVNHHWLFGVIIFAIFKIGGFGLLTIFNAFLGFSSFALIICFSQKESGFRSTLAATLLLLPLLTARIEIRPETLSLFFSAIFYVALANFNKNKIPFKILLPLLLLCQLIWVNSHLFFIFGSAITGYFWLKSLLSESTGRTKKFKQLSILLILLTAVWLLNPAGFAGAIEPFGILNEYGYSVLENQPIWKLLKLVPRPIYWYLLFASISLLGLQIWSALQKKSENKTTAAAANILFVLILTAATLYIFRLINFYALLVLPLCAQNLSRFSIKYSPYFKKIWNTTVGTMLISLSLFGFVVWTMGNSLLTPSFASMGTGIFEGNNASAEFFKNNKIAGPIFNNYDIGGYLIFYLYPETKVFVDNRPEAFPEEFFTQKYIPAQLDEKIWQELLSEYNFNVIFFHRNDLTNWGQDFLVRIIRDEAWVPVFVDDWTIILVRNTPQNQSVIDKHQLPAEMFKITGQN